MKKDVKIDLNSLEKEADEVEKIRGKMLADKYVELSTEEIEFLKRFALSGAPRGEFDYGLYLLLYEDNLKEAEKWWNKFYDHANGFALWEASGIFANLGDEYYEWSMKCLRKSAKKGFEIAKGMLKEMEDNPFHFPEA